MAQPSRRQEDDGPRRIGGAYFFVALDDFLRRDGRTPAFAFAEGLRVVGLVALQPRDNVRVGFVGEPGRLPLDPGLEEQTRTMA